FLFGADWGRQCLEEAYGSWPGHQQLADSHYEVTAFDPVKDQEWAVSLKLLGPATIKYATFTFNAAEGLDWNQVLAEIERARLASRRQNWLRDCLDLEPGNSYFQEAWTESGLKGRPAFHLVRNKTDVLLSADGETCLVDLPSQELLQEFDLTLPRPEVPVRLALEGQHKRLIEDAYVHKVEAVKKSDR
ncbi:MAG: hypothetical protein KC910_31415, partial [Candidatus Eremiobacteraeota bacterium]|nr:hypothetical protein [Candidatus Eremiobacteraeota bacterium]